MSYFKGKTVIVTGASSGIGEASAKELLLQGAKVILVSRSESKMQESFKDFSQDSYSIYPFDLTNLDEIDSFACTCADGYRDLGDNPGCQEQITPCAQQEDTCSEYSYCFDEGQGVHTCHSL